MADRAPAIRTPLRLLAWSDSVLIPTGFGTVSRHVLAALHATGRYRIDQLAINYRGEFFDRDAYPYQLAPAGLLDPADPYGNRQLVATLARGDYDLLWVLNDVEVVHGIVPELRQLQAQKRRQGRPVFKTVFYYPVDAPLWPHACDMIRFADAAVTYTRWGRDQTLAALPDLGKPVHVIPHGTDPAAFRPLPADERARARAELLGVRSPATFAVVNVNRNTARKDLPRTILAFAEFRRRVPDSKLYVHTVAGQNGIDLMRCCAALGLRVPTDVSFPDPRLLSEPGPFPPAAVNAVYNAADAYLTTTLGEGWGLTVTEAMAAGTPVVAPRHTALTEILTGPDGDRGYVYECADRVWIDSGGYRPAATTEAIANAVSACHVAHESAAQQAVLARAAAYVGQHGWMSVGGDWVRTLQLVG